MSLDRNKNVTVGFLYDLYVNKIKPYLNGASGAIDDSSTASNKTWSASKINSALDKHTYSTTERAVGTWTNGKTLYEKVISFTVPTCSTEGTEQSSTVNINSTVKIGWIESSYVKLASGNLVSVYQAPTAVRNNLLRIVIRSTDNSSSSPNTLAVFNSSTTLNGLTCYVVLKYTKS